MPDACQPMRYMTNFIFRALLTALLLITATPPRASVATDAYLAPTQTQQQAAVLITHLISKYHYRRTPLDDRISAAMLDRYLESLDPNRSYFLAEDIAAFEKYRTELDDSLLRADLYPAYIMFEIFRERLRQRVDQACALLTEEFDFGMEESYRFDRSDAPWARDRAALDAIWRQRVKNDFLGLRLAGKADAEIRETLRKRYRRLETRTAQINAGDIFQRFMNAYTATVEPHTSYFSPRTSENFRINMSLSLEGIGAVLQNENEYTLVRRIVPGGPADKCGQLHPGDRITGVGQGAAEEMVDVVGWRLDDVVDLIRGPKNTQVRLQVLPKDTGPDGPARTIGLVRNRIVLEEQAAQKSVIEVNTGAQALKVGVIDLPAFYLDFEARARGDQDYRSTSRDVRRLIGELQAEGVDGIIMDLRGNGGGSLVEATELTGLFIPEGPVVQVRDAGGRIEVEKDPDPGVAYSGPLAVLVDGHSASASEIFAGAIQDYRRGLVIGEPTYGKGTVQSIIDLDRMMDPPGEGLGQLKVTVAQFFRVSGSSTQHRGVMPDIPMPVIAVDDDERESGNDNALPWAEVRPVRYHAETIGPQLTDAVRLRHQSRVESSEAFHLLAEARDRQREMEAVKTVTLNEKLRRAEQEARKQERLARENRLRAVVGLPPRDSEPEEWTEENAVVEEKKEDPRLDVVLQESARVLADLVDLTQVPPSRVRTAGNGKDILPD